tara:strand:- start:326 stop:955 length:630 start_codon:yes stop_codon:yes gene_type:complete
MIEIHTHKLLCGDITKGAVDTVMQNEKANIIYSDPPWSLGNLRFWDTMNSKMNLVDSKYVDWDFFIKNLIKIINKYSMPETLVFIEMSIKFYEHFITLIEENTQFKIKQVFNVQYKGSGKLLPSIVMYFVNDSDYSFDEKTIDKTSGNATVENILTPIAQKDFIVLDPCTGFGRTMRVSDSLGMRFRGTELNQKRLDKAIKFLRGKYGN